MNGLPHEYIGLSSKTLRIVLSCDVFRRENGEIDSPENRQLERKEEEKENLKTVHHFTL